MDMKGVLLRRAFAVQEPSRGLIWVAEVVLSPIAGFWRWTSHRTESWSLTGTERSQHWDEAR